jgi:two-component system, OmpR family, sensor histidine kinase KdpD
MSEASDTKQAASGWFDGLGRVPGLDASARSAALKLLAAAALSILSGAIAAGLDSVLNVHSPSMTFLCGVILAAIWFGQRIALATAVFSFVVYQFYLVDPRYTFGALSVNDWLTLGVFVFAAVFVGGLAGRLHDERERARGQARIFASLFGVSRAMSERGELGDAIAQMANGVLEIAALEVVVFTPIEGGVVASARAPPDAEASPALRKAAASMMHIENRFARAAAPGCEDWVLQPLEGAERPIAVLAWKPRPKARGDGSAIAVRLLADLTQIAIERSFSTQQKIAFESLAETERLRAALMASMSHDFRTPLSTILASASSLLAFGDRFSPATHADLLTGIQEEAERLNRFVGNILDMTRLEACVLKVRKELTDPIDVLERVAERFGKRLGGRRLELAAPAAAPSINVDPILLEQAIVNVVENALVYTSRDAVIRIGADYSEERVSVWVEDDGPGVAAGELARIFDKFHRLDSSANSSHGVGLGLAISKGFVEAMHGAVAAANPAGGRGLRIEFSFPRAADRAPA